MRSFRELESRQSWDRKVSVSYLQKLQGLLYLFLQLSLLSDPQLAVSWLVLCPNQLHVILRLTTCPSLRPRVCATEESVAEINWPLDFPGQYISSYFIQKRCILQSFLRHPFIHLLKEETQCKQLKNSLICGSNKNTLSVYTF